MTVAWFSFFPVEWLSGIPDAVRRLPRQHPATWQRVLLAEFEKRSEMKIHILILRKDLERSLTFDRNGVTFHLIKTVGGMRSSSLFWHDTLLIRKTLQTINPDVVHAWGTESGAATVASRLSYPSVVTVQGLGSWNATLFPVTFYERLNAWLERWSLRSSHVVTAESNFASDFVRRLAPKLEVRHVDTVPDPLFRAVRRNPPQDKMRFLFSGQLGFRKGGDLLVLALDRLRSEMDFQLTVIGGVSPDSLQKMKGETSSDLWSRIYFRQNLQPAEVAAELEQATVFACPTRADTGPTAAKEAAVAGVPIIGSEVGGVPDYVAPGRNGYLFPSGDLEQLIKAIRQTAAHPLFARGEVESSYLAEIRARLSAERMAEQFFDTYLLAINRAKK
jgi:glycosyltransferase involved in cell wall biosynthesis